MIAHAIFATLAPKASDHETKAIFLHAGFRVCVDAGRRLSSGLNPAAFDVEIVHPGNDKSRIRKADAARCKSVPALVNDGSPYHIKFSAELAALN